MLIWDYGGQTILVQNPLVKLMAKEMAQGYKGFGRVEQVFQEVKSVLETHPVFHKCDETIRGHVLYSFLALVLRKELESRSLSGWPFF